MFKAAVVDKKITVNNPSIYDIRDAANAFVRAVQANYSINGVFNVTSGNYTIGQVGDLVKYEIKKKTGDKIKLDIKDVQDIRNYKVSFDKAKTYLGFQPLYTMADIIDSLYNHMDSFSDFEKDEFYNIRQFKKMGLSGFSNSSIAPKLEIKPL